MPEEKIKAEMAVIASGEEITDLRLYENGDVCILSSAYGCNKIAYHFAGREKLRTGYSDNLKSNYIIIYKFSI